MLNTIHIKIYMGTEEFLKKHKPLSPEEIKGRMKDAEVARTQYTKDITEIESNLVTFLHKEDPLIDPATEKVIAWIRQAPYAELQSISEELFGPIGPDMSEEEYATKIQEAGGSENIFKLMARLISRPKHDFKWWRDNATVEFIALFDARMNEIYSRMSEQMDFF